jgi:SH3-like domain-containing protein
MSGLASRLLLSATLGLLAACGPQTQQSADVASQTDQTQKGPAAPRAPAATSPPAPAPQPKATADAPQVLVVSVGRANMREAPDTKAKILQVLTKGTKVVVVTKGTQWYRVRLANGTDGWVAESVVTPTP